MVRGRGENLQLPGCGVPTGTIRSSTLLGQFSVYSGMHLGENLRRPDTSLHTEDAGEAARAYFEDTDAVIEVWPTPDPTAGMLDVRAMMNNYRAVRDYIDGRLERRFIVKS